LRHAAQQLLPATLLGLLQHQALLHLLLRFAWDVCLPLLLLLLLCCPLLRYPCWQVIHHLSACCNCRRWLRCHCCFCWAAAAAAQALLLGC
jgi:hypothetical protein